MQKETDASKGMLGEVIRLADDIIIELRSPSFDISKLEKAEKLYKSFKSIYYNAQHKEDKLALEKKMLELHREIENRRQSIQKAEKNDSIRLIVSYIDTANKAMDFKDIARAGRFYTAAMEIFSGVEFKDIGKKSVLAAQLEGIHSRIISQRKNELESEVMTQANKIKNLLSSSLFAFNSRNYIHAGELYNEAMKAYAKLPNYYPGLKAGIKHEFEKIKKIFLDDKKYPAGSRMLEYSVEDENEEKLYDELFTLVDQMHAHLEKNEAEQCKEKYAAALNLAGALNDTVHKNQLIKELNKIYSRLAILAEIEKTIHTDSRKEVINSLNEISSLHRKHTLNHPDDLDFLDFVEERHKLAERFV